jgi:hypothetical protein
VVIGVFVAAILNKRNQYLNPRKKIIDALDCSSNFQYRNRHTWSGEIVKFLVTVTVDATGALVEVGRRRVLVSGWTTDAASASPSDTLERLVELTGREGIGLIIVVTIVANIVLVVTNGVGATVLWCVSDTNTAWVMTMRLGVGAVAVVELRLALDVVELDWGTNVTSDRVRASVEEVLDTGGREVWIGPTVVVIVVWNVLVVACGEGVVDIVGGHGIKTVRVTTGRVEVGSLVDDVEFPALEDVVEVGSDTTNVLVGWTKVEIAVVDMGCVYVDIGAIIIDVVVAYLVTTVKCKEAEVLIDSREVDTSDTVCAVVEEKWAEEVERGTDEGGIDAVPEASGLEDEACTKVLGVALAMILGGDVPNEDPGETFKWERVGMGPVAVLVIVT